jgi:elongator complex protein 3
MREGVQGALPIRQGQAMVREVHVYGKAEHLHQAQEGTQHLGLGRALVAEACRIAREAGYAELNVISAVGTRAYYRKLGFVDAGLYQVKAL